MFNKYINDVDSDIFRYVYDNQNEFAGLFGEKEVRAKIRKVWTLGANRYVTGEGEEVVYDRKGFKKICETPVQSGRGWKNGYH